MKRYGLLLMVFSLVLTLAGCKPGAKYVVPEWKVGDWVEYEVQSEALGQRTLRYAITGIDTLHGEPYYWLEMISTMSESRIVNKMLVPYGYRGVAERMIIKFGDQLPIEMPQGDELSWYPSDENHPYVYLEEEIKQGKLKDSTIIVPMGEFLCTHALVNDIRHSKVGHMVGDTVVEKMISDTTIVEVWVADSIPVLGIVVLKSEREEMKLAAIGHDAATQITGEVIHVESIVFE